MHCSLILSLQGSGKPRLPCASPPVKPSKRLWSSPFSESCCKAFISSEMQPAGTCHTDVFLTGVRDKTNFLSDVCPSCLLCPFNILWPHISYHIKVFPKYSCLRWNSDWSLYQPRGVHWQLLFWGVCPEVRLPWAGSPVQLSLHEWGCCRQLRSWELLMKPTALPANYPGSPHWLCN